MAFTGSPTVKKVAENLYRVTGVTLGAGASGVIGLEGSGAEVELPGTNDWDAYGDVTLIDAIQALVNFLSAPTNPPDISMAKAGASNDAFTLTITNNDAAVTGDLEIYVRFH